MGLLVLLVPFSILAISKTSPFVIIHRSWLSLLIWEVGEAVKPFVNLSAAHAAFIRFDGLELASDVSRACYGAGVRCLNGLLLPGLMALLFQLTGSHSEFCLFSNLLSLKALDSLCPATFQPALREGQIPTLDPLQVSLGN